MPPPSDLRGARFGSLTVLGEAPRTDAKSRSWLCRCDCGAELVVLQRRLTTGSAKHQRHACDACRSRPCDICGAPVSASSTALTCSGECAAERERRYQLDYYHAYRRDDPGVIAAQAERARRDWAALSPEERRAAGRLRREGEIRRHGIEAIRARERASHARRMEDPEYAKRQRFKNATWAAENPEATKRYGREYRRRQRAAALAREAGEAAERMERDIDGEYRDEKNV